MGQYFRAVVLKKDWEKKSNPVECALSPYVFNDNLAKLMEHSYAGNSYVDAVCYALANLHYGKPFAWVGDYADEKTVAKGKKVSLYSEAGKMCETDRIKALSLTLVSVGAMEKQYAYAVNLTKGEYCKIPKFNKKEWRVHPLPLLCADGNGRGNGDYRLCTETYDYETDKRIGSWAYDCIGITNSKKAIEGLKEIDGFFEMC